MSVDRSTTTAEPSDRELLQRFGVGQDEDAFATVVRRHGPMVLRVCHRILDRREDAEDVFQATFLVLARKARSVTWQESIATWLHETARRLAADVRRGWARRQAREANHPTRTNGDALEEVTSRELLTILDDEIAGLPEENRGALLLCCLEGLSGDEAAVQLGCSPSTLKRRLRQGRELLRERLARRGVALSVAALGTLLAGGLAVASVPPALLEATTRAAVLFGSGAPLVPGLVSSGAMTLARHLLPVSVGVKIAVGLLLIGGLGAVVTLTAHRATDERAEAPPVVVPVPMGDALAAAQPPVVLGVPVTVETTLRTRGVWIRQLAFDRNLNTFFGSTDNASEKDHFTLVFDRAVAVRSVEVRTGTPNDFEGLASGRLEVSADGVDFVPLAEFANGTARGDAGGRSVRAVRVRPGAQPHPLLIREFVIDSEPPLVAFRHPVEFAVDATAAPEMAAWAERAARTCERAYPMICDELASDGFRPPLLVPLVVRRDAAALVAASRGRVIVSAGYFDANPDDIGAVIHATSFVVQAYGARPAPAWLVEGIADYIRFFKFEPGAIEPPDPDIARYDGDSRETAAFLAYLVATRDPAIVRKLNAILREGRYTDDVWLTLTGKSLRELGAEWHRSLRR